MKLLGFEVLNMKNKTEYLLKDFAEVIGRIKNVYEYLKKGLDEAWNIGISIAKLLVQVISITDGILDIEIGKILGKKLEEMKN